MMNQQYRTHLIRLALVTLSFLCMQYAASAARVAAGNGRERVLIDSGWRFHRGDIGGGARENVPLWQYVASDGTETRGATLTVAPFLTADTWKDVKAGEDTFHGQQGFQWYRVQLLNVPGPHRTLHFESVDDNATVFVNGKRLLHHEGWNEPFDVPLDAVWNEGGMNIVAVLVENTAGAGGIGAAWVEQSTPDTTAQSGPAAVVYDDKDWRTVHLPHDFVVEGTFTPSADASHGSLPTDVGWYRKTFEVPASDKGRRLWIDFDGVYRNSNVWLNGKLLGNHKSGYTGFRYDITDAVTYGGKNTLAVRADARAQEGWWYEGGGIYRHVWLNKAAPIHIAPDGVCVTSAIESNGTATIHVQAELGTTPAEKSECVMIAEVQSNNGKTLLSNSVNVSADPSSRIAANFEFSLPTPRLWSVETPTLYHLVTRIQQNGKDIDTVTTPFGIRTIKFDAQKGFLLNGKPVKIKGTCNHQDFAGVGIAMPDSLLEWRVQKLKAMGSNAYRMSHNPPAAELLDACDRQGMLVMDEARHLGDVYTPKTPRGASASDLSDLKEMVLRDRNHPSIIMWSMCNEEPLQGSEDGARIFKAMKEATLALDPTRPITCAMNGGWGNGITFVEDLQGINYSPDAYEGFHQKFPDMPVYGSETASAVSTRGEYVNDATKGYVSAYDVNAPPWAQPAEVAWKPLGQRDYMAGGYVWTGFDYKGEPTPYGWPCINSHFGIMDECGFPKDTYYYYLSWWGDKPVVHILPHWNWPGKEGQNIDVWVHSNAERVELFLNGSSLGTKVMPRLGHLEWKVPYAQGKLEAKGYKDVAATPPYAVLTTGSGSAAQTRNYKLIASDVVETTGAATQIRLTPDRKTMKANGEEVIMVEVALLDDKGRVVPYADNEVTFDVRGAGQVGGVGNGDPSSHEPDKANKRHAFHGLCMAVVQSGEQPGSVVVTATAPGLKSATIRLQARK
jgi:beta-galactosidase